MRDIAAYNAKYEKENIVRKVAKFNRHNQEDMRLLAWIEQQGAWGTYCRRLVREDLDTHENAKQ
jgi:hypothetical protein